MNSQPTASATDLQQMNQALARLTEALARSERRHAQLARTVRWGVLGLLALMISGGIVIADRTGIAHAQDPGEFPRATTAVEALNNINANLMVMGEMGKAAQEFLPAVRDALMHNEDLSSYVQQHFEDLGIDPTQQQQEQYAMQVIVQSAVGTLVDTVVLMQRIRQDSNAFRDYVTGPEDVLRGVEAQLAVMNMAMASIPNMAAQMDLMNRNMASMTYSMGSTMGRMGKWMPW